MIEIRLREILKQRGISIKAFADKLGVGPNSLPISVAFSPSLSSLQRYAEALNIPAVELVHEPEAPTPAYDGMNHCDAEPIDVFVMSRIMDEMRQQKLTQKQVAERMGVSVQSYSQTLKKNKMSTATLDKIATALGVEPWTLFVSRPEDNAAAEADNAEPRPSAFDPHDPSPIQTVTEVINNAPSSARVEPAEQQLWSKTTQTINNATLAIAHADLECEELLHSQMKVNGMGTEPDLFAQQPEPQEVVMQEGVTYVCGNTRITIVNGVMEIRVQDKKSIM